jgi:hypothetical protein
MKELLAILINQYTISKGSSDELILFICKKFNAVFHTGQVGDSLKYWFEYKKGSTEIVVVYEDTRAGAVIAFIHSYINY